MKDKVAQEQYCMSHVTALVDPMSDLTVEILDMIAAHSLSERKCLLCIKYLVAGAEKKPPTRTIYNWGKKKHSAVLRDLAYVRATPRYCPHAAARWKKGPCNAAVLQVCENCTCTDCDADKGKAEQCTALVPVLPTPHKRVAAEMSATMSAPTPTTHLLKYRQRVALKQDCEAACGRYSSGVGWRVP